MQLQGQHVLILGLGASGLAMARWCAHAGADVTVADTRETPPQLTALQAEWPAVRFVSGTFVASLVEGTAVRAVFRSPGIAPEVVAPVVDAARSMGLWQGGELSLFAAGLQDLKARFGYAPQVLAITGTNGKTTVTSLTGQLVARAGKTFKLAGNIGPTLLDTLAQAMTQAQAQVAQDAAERELAEREAAEMDSEPTEALVVQSPAPVQATSETHTTEAATGDAPETVDVLEQAAGTSEEPDRSRSRACACAAPATGHPGPHGASVAPSVGVGAFQLPTRQQRGF
jgi:UDP-N-acetylmuramoylalanine--D-glutamate ligase